VKRTSAVAGGTPPNNALEAIITHNENDEYESFESQKEAF